MVKLLLLCLVLVTAILGWTVFRGASEKSRNRSQLGATVPFKKVSLETKNKSLTLPVSINVTAACFLGDFDIMGLNASNQTGRKFIVSLESIGAESLSYPISTKPLSLKAVKSGVSLPLALPKDKSPHLLGLFICSDDENKHRCTNKQVVPLNDIVVDFYNGKKTKVSANLDKIYFFQPMLLEGSDLMVFDTGKWDGRQTLTVKTFLDAGAKRGARVDNGAFVERSQKWSKKLSSLPLSVSSKGVGISLPTYLPKSCGLAQGKPTPSQEFRLPLTKGNVNP